MYIVRTYFLGSGQRDVSKHRKFQFAVNAAALHRRGMGEGWDVRVVVPRDERADYTATATNGDAVHITH